MKKNFRECLIVSISYFLYVSVLTWPIIIHPNSMIFGYEGDSTGTIYDIWAQGIEGLRNFGYQNIHLRGAPFGFEFNYWPAISTTVPNTVAVVISRLFNEIFAYNFLIFIGLVGAPLAMYWCCRKFGINRMSSFWAGYAFGLFPFHQMAAGGWTSQVQVAIVPIFIALSCGAVLRPNFRRFLILGGLLVLAGLTNAYIFLFCGVITVVSLVTLIVSHWKKLLNIYVLVSSLLFGILSTFFLSYLFSKVSSEINRSPEEAKTYGLRIDEILQPTSLARLMPDFFKRSDLNSMHGSSIVETSQFVGYLTLFLAIIGFMTLLSRKKNLPLVLFLSTNLVAALYFGMSQGIRVGSWTVASPSMLILKIAPFWRVFSRFGIVIMAIIVIFAAHGINRTARFNKIGQVFLFIIAIALTTVELWSPLPGRTTKFVEPTYIEPLEKAEIQTIVMYPIVTDGQLVSYQQNFWQRIHKKRLVNGGPADSVSGVFQKSIANPNSNSLSQRLAALDIDAVVVDKQLFKFQYGFSFRNKDSNFKKLFEDDQFVVLQTENFNPSGSLWINSGNNPVELRENGSTWRWLSTSGEVYVFVPESGCYLIELSGVSVNKKLNYKFSFNDTDVTFTTNEKSFRARFFESGLTSGEFRVVGHDAVSKLPDGRLVSFYFGDPELSKLDDQSCSK